jgi:hypothetical protein
MAPQNKVESRTPKNKPLNITKAGSQTLKQFFLSCSVAALLQHFKLFKINKK